jgi:ubiquinone biosynthesis protein UbiJ
MPDYRTPLPSILAAILESAVNRVLALDEDTPARLQRLDGRMLRLDLDGVGITLFFTFSATVVHVSIDSDDEPDTVISGSPFALFSMAVPDGDGSWQGPDSRVNISGDATLARDLERLFSRLDPDWESTLSRLFGDVWGHQVAAGIRSGSEQAKEAAGNAAELVSEFLKRESGPLVPSAEIKKFADAVDETRDAVERLEARIRIMKETDSPEGEA